MNFVRGGDYIFFGVREGDMVFFFGWGLVSFRRVFRIEDSVVDIFVGWRFNLENTIYLF